MKTVWSGQKRFRKRRWKSSRERLQILATSGTRTVCCVPGMRLHACSTFATPLPSLDMSSALPLPLPCPPWLVWVLEHPTCAVSVWTLFWVRSVARGRDPEHGIGDAWPRVSSSLSREPLWASNSSSVTDLYRSQQLTCIELTMCQALWDIK